jgi:hypothetical protein
MDISTILGLIVGATIGFAFAWLQLQALHRNELLERQLDVPRWMQQIPGSMGRVAFLLMTLVGAQVLFGSNADARWMALGVALAYALPFAIRLKEKFGHR